MDQHSIPHGPQHNFPGSSHQSSQNQLPYLNIVLTPEEIKILNECRSNAVFHRGFPLGAVVAGGYYYMMNKGILKRNMAGLVFSGLAGFFIGTISYRGICMEKLLSLPNSTLKERILAAQGVQPQVRVDVNAGDGFFDSLLPSSDPPQSSSFEMEPYQSNQLDSYDIRPIDTETAYAVNPPLQPAQRESYTSYDELRRRNRDEYYKGNSMPSGPRGPAPPSSSMYSPTSPSVAPLQQSRDRTSEERQKDDFQW